jgi:hypothetical protein
MNDDKEMVRHFLAALAYRTQKALRSAPESFPTFDPGFGLRRPHDLIRHMNSVLHYGSVVLQTGNYDYRSGHQTLSWQEDVSRFHSLLKEIDEELIKREHIESDLLKRLLQGPLSDAMTHAGQLAMLRRMSGSPVPSENFVKADIQTGRVSENQPAPVSPDK